ncbi:MAG: phosphatase PAP2 family protein [Bacteroidales bacterium]
MRFSFRTLLASLLPVDWAVFAYILLTAVLNIAFYNRVPGGPSHLLVRLAVVLIAVALIWLSATTPSRLLRFMRYFYPLATLAYFYGETYFYHSLFFPYFDGLIMQVDQAIFGFQPSLEFSRVFHWTWLNELMNFAYFFYYIMIFGVCFAVYRYNSLNFNRCIFAVMQSFFIYYLVFILFPVMGPQFWFPEPLNKLADAGIFRELVKFAQEVGEYPTGAFPSSHVAMSVILCIITYKYVIQLFPFALAIAMLLTLSAVYIKAHYASDIIGGIITAPFIYWLSTLVYDAIANRYRLN